MFGRVTLRSNIEVIATRNAHPDMSPRRDLLRPMFRGNRRSGLGDGLLGDGLRLGAKVKGLIDGDLGALLDDERVLRLR